MTVEQLIAELEKHPKEAEVWIETSELYAEVREVGLYYPKGKPPVVTLGS